MDGSNITYFNDDLDDIMLNLDFDDLSATKPYWNEPTDEEIAAAITRQELVLDLPPVLPSSPSPASELDRALSTDGVVCHRIGDTLGRVTASACCTLVPREAIDQRYELLRQGWRKTPEHTSNEKQKEGHCVGDERWGLRCLWHRCESDYGEEMRRIHDNGEGVTIRQEPSRPERIKSWICSTPQTEARRISELDSEKKRKRKEEKMGEVFDRRYRGLKHSKRDVYSSLAQLEHQGGAPVSPGSAIHFRTARDWEESSD